MAEGGVGRISSILVFSLALEHILGLGFIISNYHLDCSLQSNAKPLANAGLGRTSGKSYLGLRVQQ